MKYSEINVGDRRSFFRDIIEEDIYKFADLTGDYNPIHMRAIFNGKRIVHGMFTGSLFSTIFGMEFPGEGSIYVTQDLKFLVPVCIGDKVEVIVEVKEKLPRNKVLFDCMIYNQNEELVVTGTAVLKVTE